jgi:hypothetical protein
MINFDENNFFNKMKIIIKFKIHNKIQFVIKWVKKNICMLEIKVYKIIID